MNLNDLLKGKNIDPERVLVFRHQPSEARLKIALPLLAANRPDLFDAYQRFQTEKVETVMLNLVGSGYVASFIAHGGGKALFIGLYKIAASKPLSYRQYWQIPSSQELREEFGHGGFKGERPQTVQFDLTVVQEFYASWKGKLVVDWPPPDRSWWRRAHRNTMPVHAILEESALDAPIEDWRKIDFRWAELQILGGRMRNQLSQWRAIYYIFDDRDGKGYVGSAYGKHNLIGRWLGYAATGHGGNLLLRDRDPQSFRFTILERVSPDMDADEVIGLESTWKDRLHTRTPFGLNNN